MLLIIFMVLLYSGSLIQSILPMPNPFEYNLGVNVISARNSSEVTICCHGYGHSNKFVEVINSYNVFNHTLVGFNFPDYNITDASDHSRSVYGSIHEILPLLYVINYYASDRQISKINLYGFSAGGGAIINAFAILNQYSHKDDLQKIGISEEVAQHMLNIMQKGTIILECPLKSMQEIIDLRGATKPLLDVAHRYDYNRMNPIDNICLLLPLCLNIILYFEVPDEVIGNRDDDLFMSRLKQANSGNTIIITGTNGGHAKYHSELWLYFKHLQHRAMQLRT